MRVQVFFLLILILMVAMVSSIYSTENGWVAAGAYAWYYETPTTSLDGYAWCGWDDMQTGNYRCEVVVTVGGQVVTSTVSANTVYGSGGNSASSGVVGAIEGFTITSSSGISGTDFGGTYRADWDWDSASAP